MGIFSSLFGNAENQDHFDSNVNWISLNTIGQLNEIITTSEEKPVIIFKHSTRCGISRMVLKQFEKQYNLEDQVEPYLLDLLEHRDISNAIAERFDVEHQSPQLLLIKAGKSVYDASHNAIDVINLNRKL